MLFVLLGTHVGGVVFIFFEAYDGEPQLEMLKDYLDVVFFLHLIHPTTMVPNLYILNSRIW